MFCFITNIVMCINLNINITHIYANKFNLYSNFQKKAQFNLISNVVKLNIQLTNL